MARSPKAPWVPEVEPEGLSSQQKEIWRLAREGFTTREIAALLKTTKKTVENQLRRIRINPTSDVNKFSGQVSYAHRPEEEIDEDLTELISSEDLSLQQKVKLLSESGQLSMRAMADHLGTSYGAVRVMRWRLRQEARRSRTVRRRLTAEEALALPSVPAGDLPVMAGLAYEAYVVHAGSSSPAALAARRLLGALGGGGPVRQLAFSDRSLIFKRLLAERKGLMKLAGKNVYWLVRDVLEQEFVPMADGVLCPRRRLSWEAFRAALEERFRAITAGSKIRLEEAGEREGLPVYELRMGWDNPVAAAVRRLDQAYYVVARADRLEGPGKRLATGRLERWDPAEGRAVLAAEAGQIAVECCGIAVRHGGCLWGVGDPRLARAGDPVEAVGSYLVVGSRDIKLVVFSEEEVARLAAWLLAGKDCYVRVAGPGRDGGGSWREIRFEPPYAERVILVDVESLDWEEAAGRELAELTELERRPQGRSDPRGRTLRVRPGEDPSRYRVISGALRVAEAVEKGAGQVPAVVELPRR